MMHKNLIFLLLFSVILVGCNTKKLEIENTVKLLLLSELSALPEKDRLKAIEDYHGCIQNLRLTHREIKKYK